MKKIITMILMSFILGGCFTSPLPTIRGYHSLSNIMDGGYPKDEREIEKLKGKTIKIWGYLDFHNIFLEKGIIENQPFCWSIQKNSLRLKARKNDKTGSGITISFLGDIRQYKKIFEKLRDITYIQRYPESKIFEESEEIREFKPTKILVKGVLQSEQHPTNFSAVTLISLKVSNADDVQFVGLFGTLEIIESVNKDSTIRRITYKYDTNYQWELERAIKKANFENAIVMIEKFNHSMDEIVKEFNIKKEELLLYIKQKKLKKEQK